MRDGMKMKMKMKMKMMVMVMVMAMVIVIQMKATSGQQSYVKNHQLDCYNHFNSTDGYVCNGVASSCLSYLTFRSSPPNYNSPVSIAYLLDSDATLIAKANNISDVDTIPTDRLVIVPVNCSCAGRSYYQHNASYLLKRRSETYFSVANNTYQGLTTCQALMSQNSYGDRNLSVNLDLHIPLRCACPTANQTVNYLLVYLVTWHDDIPSIAARFRVQPQSLLDANRLSSGDIIYPFTPLLVPLTTDPSQILQPEEPPSPPPPPTPQSIPANNSKSSSNKWVLVGAAALLVLLLLALSAFLLRRRCRKPKPQPLSTSSPPEKNNNIVSNDHSPLPETTKSSSISWSSSLGVRSAVESLTLYKLEEVQRATDSFSETNKIRGSVYRGRFKGDEAAIKVMKGDVSDEINILKRINHSSIIRLSGFCVSGGNTYLVYEYAESGSLSDLLHLHPPTKLKLPWKQRVEIAHDVADALNYLHNFAHPPYIHKNLKSSNILLDANLRAKLSNFGLATQTRVVTGHDDDDQAQLHLTRHVVGTQGYMAPEYIESGLVTPKLDVFAFGVIILELLSGKPASPEQEANYNNKDNNNNNQREELLSESIRNVLEGDNVRDKLRDFMDPALRLDYPFDLAFSMAQLAKRCVARDLNSRPEITEAFMTLSKILSSTRDWDPSDELQHSRSMSNGR
uniref:Lysm-containing receptor kinase 10 n=1 Tax=Parasponia rigida TaxID=3477 RepID=A0A221I0U7_PARRI|nr:lysm-containing receptor kinase 10 [Parasponia rigida]